MINYLFQSSLILIVLMAIYMIFLKKARTFVFNRFYLLLALLFAFSIPTLQIDYSSSQYKSVISSVDISNVSNTIGFNQDKTFSIGSLKEETPLTGYLILFLYLSGSMLFFIRFGNNLYRIKQLIKRKGPPIYTLQAVLVEKSIKPFSFFNYLFINENKIEEVKQNQSLLLHEQVHSRQLHSLDILLVEFLKCFLWFNPLVWFYKNEISENHEYLADYYASNTQKDVYQYAISILESSKAIKPVPLTSGFGYLLIKKRIKMLNQSQTSIMSKTIKISTSILVAVLVLTLSAFKLHESPSSIVEGALDETSKSIPSILPIKKENIIKISSGYGMRVHPVQKAKKMHTGIDFIAKEGTPIIATADGEVVVSEFSDNYGNHIRIKHNETYETQYAHMNTLNIKAGQFVKSGEVIGIIGNSGKSVGIHLHYEVIKNEKKIDPSSFFNYEIIEHK